MPEGKQLYLFGTIHMPIDSVEWHSGIVYNLIRDSVAYYGEMDLSQIQEGYNGSNLISGGKTIEECFPGTKKYKKVRTAILKAFNVDLEQHKYLKPILIQHIIDKNISRGDGEIMDYHLWKYMESEKIPGYGLESFKDQIDILESIDLDYQISILKTISRSTSKYKKKVEKMIGLYNRQDIISLYKTGAKSCGKYRKLIIHQRNLNMVDKILKIQHERAFVSVGIGHLYGQKGILAGLKRNGAKLKPMTSQD